MDPLRWAVSHWSTIAWQWSVRMERNGSPIVAGQWNWPCCGCNYSRLCRLDHFWSWLWNFGGCGFSKGSLNEIIQVFEQYTLFGILPCRDMIFWHPFLKNLVVVARLWVQAWLKAPVWYSAAMCQQTTHVPARTSALWCVVTDPNAFRKSARIKTWRSRLPSFMGDTADDWNPDLVIYKSRNIRF